MIQEDPRKSEAGQQARPETAQEGAPEESEEQEWAKQKIKSIENDEVKKDGTLFILLREHPQAFQQGSLQQREQLLNEAKNPQKLAERVDQFLATSFTGAEALKSGYRDHLMAFARRFLFAEKKRLEEQKSQGAVDEGPTLEEQIGAMFDQLHKSGDFRTMMDFVTGGLNMEVAEKMTSQQVIAVAQASRKGMDKRVVTVTQFINDTKVLGKFREQFYQRAENILSQFEATAREELAKPKRAEEVRERFDPSQLEGYAIETAQLMRSDTATWDRLFEGVSGFSFLDLKDLTPQEKVAKYSSALQTLERTELAINVGDFPDQLSAQGKQYLSTRVNKYVREMMTRDLMDIQYLAMQEQARIQQDPEHQKIQQARDIAKRSLNVAFMEQYGKQGFSSMNEFFVLQPAALDDFMNKLRRPVAKAFHEDLTAQGAVGDIDLRNMVMTQVNVLTDEVKKNPRVYQGIIY